MDLKLVVVNGVTDIDPNWGSTTDLGQITAQGLLLDLYSPPGSIAGQPARGGGISQLVNRPINLDSVRQTIARRARDFEAIEAVQSDVELNNGKLAITVQAKLSNGQNITVEGA